MKSLKKILVEGAEDPRVKRLASARGYTIETYRGDADADEIHVYTRKERVEHGLFTTPVLEAAKIYARDNNPRKFYVRAPKLLDLTKDTLENMMWVKKWGETWEPWRDPGTGEAVDAWDILEGGRMFDYEGNWSRERWIDIQATAQSEGFDAIVLPDFDSDLGVFPSLIIFDERNIKLADTMTFDDERHPIPFHLRFDKTSDDIGY